MQRRMFDEAIRSIHSTDCFVESNSLRSFDTPRNDFNKSKFTCLTD